MTHTHEFVEVDYLNGNIKLLSRYVGALVKNDLQCLICGYLWKAIYSSFQSQNCGCPKCAGLAKPTQEFVEADYLKGRIKLLSRYVNYRVKNDLECLECEYLWKAAYTDFRWKNSGCPECYRLSKIGETNPNWNHELTKEDREKHRNRNYILGYRLWVEAVYDRDKYTCQFCGSSISGTLNAHHIDSWATHKSERLNVDNGVTLCKTCHDACHDYHKHALSHLSATHETFYYWMIKECKIKPENWSWNVQYPDSMSKTLFYSKRQNLNNLY